MNVIPSLGYWWNKSKDELLKVPLRTREDFPKDKENFWGKNVLQEYSQCEWRDYEVSMICISSLKPSR